MVGTYNYVEYDSKVGSWTGVYILCTKARLVLYRMHMLVCLCALIKITLSLIRFQCAHVNQKSSDPYFVGVTQDTEYQRWDLFFFSRVEKVTLYFCWLNFFFSLAFSRVSIRYYKDKFWFFVIDVLDNQRTEVDEIRYFEEPFDFFFAKLWQSFKVALHRCLCVSVPCSWRSL